MLRQRHIQRDPGDSQHPQPSYAEGRMIFHNFSILVFTKFACPANEIRTWLRNTAVIIENGDNLISVCTTTFTSYSCEFSGKCTQLDLSARVLTCPQRLETSHPNTACCSNCERDWSERIQNECLDRKTFFRCVPCSIRFAGFYQRGRFEKICKLDFDNSITILTLISYSCND